MKARIAAAEVISEVLLKKASLNSLIPTFTKQVDAKDQGFFKELCFGTLRWYPRIALVLDQLLAKPFKPKDYDLLALLASAIYQLEFTRVPPHAAINETVSATQLLKKAWAKGLVNGVLRNYQRNAEQIHNSLSSQPSYNTAHPEWLVKLWQQTWPDHFEEIIAANNQRAPMTLRVNTAAITRDEYLLLLGTKNLPANKTVFSDTGISLHQPVDVNELPGFSEGLVSVQDEAAQLAAGLLKPQQGERILDACCAPGGKLSHLIEAINFSGTVHGVEIDATRLNRVDENIARIKALKRPHLDLHIFTADAAKPPHWWDGEVYQKILLDAPCSATGVIRRNPDIKLLRTPADIQQLAVLQLDLLQNLWPILQNNGFLLYATCSLIPAENDAVIKTFINNVATAQLQTINATWGVATPFGRQLFPQIAGHDGFYYALLQKIAVN